MNEKIDKFKEIVDRQEQYTRCNCLLLHVILISTDDLILKTVNEKMNIELSSSDLDKTHRIGQKKS